MNIDNLFMILEHDPIQSSVIALFVGATFLLFWGWTEYRTRSKRLPMRMEERWPFLRRKEFGRMVGGVGTIICGFTLFVIWLVWVFPVEMITAGNINMEALTATEGFILIAIGGLFAFRLWQIGTGRMPLVNMLAVVFAFIVAFYGTIAGLFMVYPVMNRVIWKFGVVAVMAISVIAVVAYVVAYAVRKKGLFLW